MINKGYGNEFVRISTDILGHYNSPKLLDIPKTSVINPKKLDAVEIKIGFDRTAIVMKLFKTPIA